MYAVIEDSKKIVNTFIKMFTTNIETKRKELFKLSLNFVNKSTISLSTI